MNSYLVTAALAGALILTGCPDDTSSSTPDATPTCPEGTLNCPCTAESSCNEGLACASGFCIEDTTTPCPEGSEGCPCYANGTCDAKDGTAMACVDSVCTEASTSPGGLGDPCDDDNPCGSDNGTQLECTDSTCSLPETPCPVGTSGCPCDAGDVCTGELICTGGVCFEPTCTAGTLDCPCDTGDSCTGALVCTEGVCKEASVVPGVGLGVSNVDVRACGLILELADVTVVFDASVTGRSKRDGTRLAIAFTANGDAAPSTVASIIDATGTAVDLSGVTPTSVECFDRLGQPVATPGITLTN